ncbi:acyl-CoA dehydrogenase family protein [Mycolicibacterium septicum]|uniref:acyl-CoA dehydrogenase family protein n=1 Tax=Mycolicibacterium septicum TaxID=98668 RepID=UPI0023616757|nr:acyl-CoA dehydrogenase family protein [Mycolicibacterium septicum]
MHWELSEEQNLYADSLREWLSARATSERVRGWLESADGQSFDTELIEEGWAAVGFEEEAGGQGGGLLELALTARELARAAAPCSGWLARAVAEPALAAEPELRRLLAERGEVTALAVRCDRIPSAPQGLSFDGRRVSGEVSNVLAAEVAKRFVIPVAGADGNPTLVVVDRDARGVRVRPHDLLDRSRSAADVAFDGAQARLIGDADAAAALTRSAHRAAVLVAADALGAAERMLAMTVEYAKQRKQFGRPIASFQAIKHAGAQMLVAVEAAYSVSLYAAASLQDGHPDAALHAAAAKAQVTRSAADLADSALTVHGAIGYTWEYDLQLLYKRAKLDRVLFGTPAAWNERIASGLPLLPRAS